MTKTNKICAIVFSLVMCTMCLLAGCDFSEPGHLYVNKTEYMAGEEISVRATGGGDAWVGLYFFSDDVELVEAIAWFPVAKSGFIPGQVYGFRRSAIFNTERAIFTSIPSGKYKIVYFTSNSKKSATETKNIVVNKTFLTVPQAPLDMDYVLKDATDGFAEGTITFTIAANNPASEVELYWANENGILPEYTALATYKLIGDGTTIELPEKMIIPQNATKLRAYAKNTLGISTDFCEIDLPENCQYKLDSTLLSEFQVVSDLHIAAETWYNLAPGDTIERHWDHFNSMCRDILENSPNSGGVCVNGDIADRGEESDWQKFESLKNAFPDLPQFNFSVGNHDMLKGFEYGSDKFFKYANTDSIYYMREIDGFHHIFLGQESGGNLANMSDAQLEWFDNTMKTLSEQEGDKPVFVYLHQSLYDTVAGSLPGQDWNGVLQEEQFREILRKYSQIILFNSHSHWDLNSYRNMYVRDKNLPNIFNTSSVGYVWDSFYNKSLANNLWMGEWLHPNSAQGYYVRVYDDRVMVLGREFVTGQWIPNACYEVKI